MSWAQTARVEGEAKRKMWTKISVGKFWEKGTIRLMAVDGKEKERIEFRVGDACSQVWTPLSSRRL